MKVYKQKRLVEITVTTRHKKPQLKQMEDDINFILKNLTLDGGLDEVLKAKVEFIKDGTAKDWDQITGGK